MIIPMCDNEPDAGGKYVCANALTELAAMLPGYASEDGGRIIRAWTLVCPGVFTKAGEAYTGLYAELEPASGCAESKDDMRGCVAAEFERAERMGGFVRLSRPAGVLAWEII